MGDAATIKKIVELPRESVEKFESLYPQRGAWTWFIREVLIRFVELHNVSDRDELINLALQDINVKDS